MALGKVVHSLEHGFPMGSPIATPDLLGLLSSIALSVLAVRQRRVNHSVNASTMACPVKKSTFAQFNFVHFCSDRYSRKMGRGDFDDSLVPSCA
jgi:hypothetical protein